MAREDWTLAVIAAAGPSGLSPAQLQKTLFLLGRAYPGVVGDDFYVFQPYDYGPFCVDIYRDAASLGALGLVLIENSDHTWARRYIATANGFEAAARYQAAIPQPVAEYVGKVVSWAQRLSFEQLVRAIYDRFPEQKAHSVFQS